MFSDNINTKTGAQQTYKDAYMNAMIPSHFTLKKYLPSIVEW